MTFQQWTTSIQWHLCWCSYFLAFVGYVLWLYPSCRACVLLCGRCTCVVDSPFCLLENESSLKSYVLFFCSSAGPVDSSQMFPLQKPPLSYMLLDVHGLAATRRNCCPGLFRLWVNSGWDFPKLLCSSWAQRTVDGLRACWLDGDSHMTAWVSSSTVKSEKKPMIQMTVCTPLCMLH